MKKIVIALTALLAAGVCMATALCFSVLFAPKSVFSSSDSALRIVLDAGHGGIDCGVRGKTTGIKESDINLAITLALGEMLESSGFEVTHTRKTQAGLYGTTARGFKKRDMERRKAIVDEAKPSLLISVHQNFYPTSGSRGAQVFYEKNAEKSARFALALQTALNGLYAKEGVKNRKSATGDYFMLRISDCPSVIVECGFLSNPSDEKLLASSSWQKATAEAIVEGIKAYLYDYSS